MTERLWLPATIKIGLVHTATGERSTKEVEGWTCQGLGLDERESGAFVVTHLSTGTALLTFTAADLTAAIHIVDPMLKVSDWTFTGPMPEDQDEASRIAALMPLLMEGVSCPHANLADRLRNMLGAALPGCRFLLLIEGEDQLGDAGKLVITTITQPEQAIEFAQDMTGFMRTCQWEGPAGAVPPSKAH